MANPPAIRAVRVRIAGRVQGVTYRTWTKRRAEAHLLSGWVRNLAGGDVEAVFSGPAAAVDAMLAECREGPRLARVETVEVIEEVEPVAGPFTVRRDR
jgi:acylphosphatase